MANMAKFKKIVSEYSDVADFVLIYIEEAHASEDWVIPGNIEISTHSTLDERRAAARLLVSLESLECPVLVDGLDDQANKQYTALPERLFVLLDSKIAYHGGQGPFKYDLKEVVAWLDTWKKSQ